MMWIWSIPPKAVGLKALSLAGGTIERWLDDEGIGISELAKS